MTSTPPAIRQSLPEDLSSQGPHRIWLYLESWCLKRRFQYAYPFSGLFVALESLSFAAIGIEIAKKLIMINAQLLAKALASPGQNAQSRQGKPSGPSAARNLGSNQDPTDLTVKNEQSLKDTQDRRSESATDSRDFKHALNEKMAEPKQDPASEETPDKSQDAETTALQAAVTPVQGSAQSPAPQPDPLMQPMLEVPDAPETGKLMTTEPSLANQTQAQHDLVKEPVMPQTPKVSAVATATDAALDKVDSPKDSNPASPTPGLSVTQADTHPNAGPIQQTPPAPPVGLPAEQGTAQPVGLPAAQGTAKPVEPQAVISEEAGSQSKQTDTVQPQPVDAQTKNTPLAPESPQAQPLPASTGPNPEQTTKPTVDIQSLPQETSQRVASKAEPLNMSPAEQKPRAEAPEPIQVTHPNQQTVTAALEASHKQSDLTGSPDSSETEGGLQPTLSTTPVIPSSETQATPTSTEAPLPRTLDPATTSVARQIQDSIAQGIQQDSRQIIIRLDPPELGRVALKFHEGDQGITGVLEVQRSQTRQDIQQALPEIVQHLQHNGVQIKRIEVLMSADADPDSFEDQAFSQTQDQNLEQQQTSGQNTSHRNPSFRWSSSHTGVVHSRQPQYVSDQGINMLI